MQKTVPWVYTSAELPNITGWEPKQLANDKDDRHFIEDNQLVEH